MDEADRRNGRQRPHLLSEPGGTGLWVPRTRRYCPTAVVRAYAGRSIEIDRVPGEPRKAQRLPARGRRRRRRIDGS